MARLRPYTLEILDNINKDIEIYRIFELNNLLNCFNKSRNVLVSPCLWDDPYEDILKYSYGIDKNKPNVKFVYNNYTDSLFAQCWTLLGDNELTWRIFSRSTNSVMVKTTVRKLYEFIEQHGRHNSHFYRGYIGKVNYKSKKYINESVKLLMRNINTSDDSFIKYHFYTKRNLFKFEKEIRVVIKSYKTNNGLYHNEDYIENNNTYGFPVDPCSFYDQIIFHPLTTDDNFKLYDYLFKNKFKFKNKCIKSQIYNKPKIVTDIV